MPTWSVADIVQRTQGTLVWGEPHRQVHGVSTDSRTVPAGALFVALRGEHFDGHQFTAMALQRGAAAVLLSDVSGTAACQASAATSAGIGVADTQEALQALALAQRRQWQDDGERNDRSGAATTLCHM